jgi:fumarate hydratase subunit alpha
MLLPVYRIPLRRASVCGYYRGILSKKPIREEKPMRELEVRYITDAVEQLCIRANRLLPNDVKARLETAHTAEPEGLAKEILGDLVANFQLAERLCIPVCQDTGMAVVFVELGQEVHLIGGSLEEAVNAGVAKGYTQGLLRCSVVGDPLRRVNTDDNTPAILHLRLVPGDRVRLTVAPKGAGSENMSTLRMMTPAATRQDLVDYVVECVRQAGSNPCPPVIVGVGIGGNFERCALLAKEALCRPTDQLHPDPFYAELEGELLEAVNATGIGPQGFGGRYTALAVHVAAYATHIASLPVAVNMGCHVTRHQSVTL